MPPFTPMTAHATGGVLSRSMLRSKAMASILGSASSSSSSASSSARRTSTIAHAIDKVSSCTYCAFNSSTRRTNNLNATMHNTFRMMNHHSNINMNNSNSTRHYSTMKKDKYGRFVHRKKVAIRPRTNETSHLPSSSSVSSSQLNRKGKFKWPKVPKIITPTNIPLQQMQPPPTGNLNALKSSTTCGSKSVTSAVTSLSSSLSLGQKAATALSSSSSSSIPSSLSTSSTSREKKVLSGIISQSTNQKTHRKFSSWFHDNLGTIILNIGSICTLTAFTRTDMLELRLLSMAGSCSTLYYFLRLPKHQIIYGPIIWAMIFLGTNSFMAYKVIEEREGKTRQFTNDEEDVYDEHFLPYGITPRQYEKLLSICQQITLKRGEVLIKKDDVFDAVYLVTSGSTSAMTSLSRRVTAASSKKGNREKLGGGDAGAWIGELAFLEKLGSKLIPSNDYKSRGRPAPPALIRKHFSNSWEKVVEITIGKYRNRNSNGADANVNASTTSTSSNTDNVKNRTIATTPIGNETNKKEKQEQNQLLSLQRKTTQQHQHHIHDQALLTYIANEDSVLYKWDFEELADLLNSSAELRLAVTRAMTAAVVHKVVNLYLSKSDAGDDGDSTLWKHLVDDVNEMHEKADHVEKGKTTSTNPKMKRLGTLRINVMEKK